MSVFDRADEEGIARGERALVVLPDLAGSMRSVDARLDEAEGLAEAIGIAVVGKRAFRIRQARPASLFGKGQAEEIGAIASDREAQPLDRGRRLVAGATENP